MRLTEAERETCTYVAVEGPMFTVGDVERILTARSADMEARIRALHYRCAPDYGFDDPKVNGYCHECVAAWPCPTVALLDAAPAGGAETTPGIREFWSETACHADRDGECHWEGCPQLCDGEPKATGRHCPLDAPSEVPHD